MKQKPLKYNIMHNKTNLVFESITKSVHFIQKLTAKHFRVKKNMSHMQPSSDLNHA